MKTINKIIFKLILISIISLNSINYSFGQQQNTDSIELIFKDLFPNCEIEELKTKKPFLKKYQLKVEQKLNHNDEKSEIFKQRFFILHRCTNCPNVVVTEGYSGFYAKFNNYNDEVARYLKANIIFIEHRYFGESEPINKETKWSHLTVKNAAADHNYIISKLKTIYPSKWVATGTSKGGSTAIYLKALYPDVVDAVVAYVAPLTNRQEDKRPINYLLKNAGSTKERKIIEEYQICMFKNINKLVELFEQYSSNTNTKYPLGYYTTIEYMILEYPFSHFQWGVSINNIPNAKSDIKTHFNHLIGVVQPSSYDQKGLSEFGPYYYQAYTEIGYYNYNDYLPKFKKYLKLKDYSNIVFLPTKEKVIYNAETHNEILEKLKTATNILQIHGAVDPWRYAAWTPQDTSRLPMFIHQKGNHSVKIENFEFKEQNRIFEYLEKWLNLKIER